MGNKDKAPECIVVEFLRSSGEPVRLIDLGAEFLNANNVDHTEVNKPFRVAITKKASKAGNAFYDYFQNGVPLPDGLATFIRVEGAIVPMGKIRPSQKGYPTRDGVTKIVVGGLVYKVTAYITESRAPYYVKVIAHKQPDPNGNTSKTQNAPWGGKIV
jgi:hypothetical protein